MCNYSNEAPRACAEAGVEAITVDYHAAEGAPRMHVQGDARRVIYRRWWAGVLGFPSCTNTARSGADRFAAKIAAGLQWHGLAFYCALWCAPTNVCILEHSISVVPQYVPVTMQRVQPYMFEGGGDVRKAADLAIRGAPDVPTLPAELWPASTRNYTHEHREAERDAREVVRSRTEPAMARALVAHMIAHAGAPPDVASVPAMDTVIATTAALYAADGHPLPAGWDDLLARRPGGDEALLTEAEGRATRRGMHASGKARLRHALRPLECAHGRAPIPCTAAWWDDGLMPDGSRPCRRPACARRAAALAAAPADEVDAALRANLALIDLAPLQVVWEASDGDEAMASAFGPQDAASVDLDEDAAWRPPCDAQHAAEALAAALRRLAARHLRRRGEHSCKQPRLRECDVDDHALETSRRRVRDAESESSAPTEDAPACDDAQVAGDEADAAPPAVTVYIVPTNHQRGTVKMMPGKAPFSFTLGGDAKPGARRATAAETAARMLPGILPEDPSAACFVAGIVGDSLMVVVPTTAEPWAPSGVGAWLDEHEVGKDTSAPHHRVAACALARAGQLARPTSARQARAAGLQGGVGGEVHFTRHRGEHAPPSEFDAALHHGTQHLELLRLELLRVAGERGGHVGECLLKWADRVAPPATDEMPAALRASSRDIAQAGIELLPFVHRCRIHRTEKMTAPEPQPAAESALKPTHVRDVLTPKAIDSIKRKLREITLWHARRLQGKPAQRPSPLALGASAFQPAARGRVWDLRHDPPRLLDTTVAAFDTHLGVDFIEEALGACADRELVGMVRYGVSIQAELQHQIVICPNLLSLYDGVGIDAVTDELGELLKRKWYGACKFIPFAPWRASPRGAVPRPGGGVPRGIGDLGAPRTPLTTVPEGETVVSVNTATGCGRRQQALAGDEHARWTPETKPAVADAAVNAAILRVPADAAGEPVFTIAFDFKYYFHQLFFRPSEYWKLGAVMPIPDPGGGASGRTQCLTEHVLTMGLAPSSQVAQRLANALMQALLLRLDAADEAARASGEREHPAIEAWLSARRPLPHDEYGTQARLADALMYTDDPHCTAVGVKRTVRMLCCLHELCGPDALNLMYAKEAKWQLSLAVIWQGVGVAPALGLLWVPRAKALRAIAAIEDALHPRLSAVEYRQLVGLLESFVVATSATRSDMDDLYGPMQPGGEVEVAPGRPLPSEPARDAALRAWQHRLANNPGASILAQLAPAPVHEDVVRWRPQSDAAVGDVHPDGRAGLGGYLYGYYWHLSTLAPVTIPVAELLAAFINIIVFEPLLRHADCIVLEIDALATPAVLAAHHARAPTMRAALDEAMRLPEVQAMLAALLCEHSFGENNTAADAASRMKWDVLEAVAAQLGHRLQRIELPGNARAFLDAVLVRCGCGLHRAPDGGECDPAAPGGTAIRFMEPEEPPDTPPRDCLSEPMSICPDADYDADRAAWAWDWQCFQNAACERARRRRMMEPYEERVYSDPGSPTPSTTAAEALAMQQQADHHALHGEVDALADEDFERGQALLGLDRATLAADEARHASVEAIFAPGDEDRDCIHEVRRIADAIAAATSRAHLHRILHDLDVAEEVRQRAEEDLELYHANDEEMHTSVEALGCCTRCVVCWREQALPDFLFGLGVCPSCTMHDGPPGMLREIDSEEEPSPPQQRRSPEARHAIDCATPLLLPSRPSPSSEAPGGARSGAIGGAHGALTMGTLHEVDSEPRPRQARCESPMPADRSTGAAALWADSDGEDDPHSSCWAFASLDVPKPEDRTGWLRADDNTGATVGEETRACAGAATARVYAEHRAAGKPRLQCLQAEQMAAEMLRGLQIDDSRHALRPRSDEALALSCLRLTNLLLGHVNRNTAVNEASNWRHWVDFCATMRTSPWRDDATANGGGDGHAREVNLLALGLLHIYARMKPGKRSPGKPPKPSSALAVLRGVRRIHKRLGHTMVDLGLATRLAAALSDEYVLEHGPEALMAHRTEPLSNEMVEWLVLAPSGTKLGDGSTLDESSLASTSMRACFATMARTGFRADEVSLRGGHEFTMKKLSRWHLRWRIGGEWVYSPTAAQLRALVDGDFAILIPPCSKADQFGIEWGPSPIWLRYSTDERVNAARELAALELKDPVSGEARRSTPLFVDGRRQPVSITQLRARFKALLLAKFTQEEAQRVSLHSFRVYLACALLALKRSHAEIQALLRWKTDEALRIYARLSSSAYADLLVGVGDANIDQVRTQNLPVHDVGAHAEALHASRQSLDAAADAADDKARGGDYGEDGETGETGDGDDGE